MLITTYKTELLAALGSIRKALSSHNPNPILDGIYIETKDNNLCLIASDSTIQIERNIPISSNENCAIVLPGLLFSEISSKMPDEEIQISQQADQIGVSIKSARFSMNLQGMPADNYPQMPKLNDYLALTISQKLLKEMIIKTVSSASQDQSRPILTGLLFEVEQENQLSIVALSNNRLAIAKESCVASSGIRSVIPASSLNKIVSILSDEQDKTAQIHFGKSQVFFDLGETRVYSANLAGEFMKYRALIPEQSKTDVYVSRKDLSDAIARASLMIRENDKKFVRLLIEGESMVINSNSEMGYVRETISINSTGPEIEIAFNAKYLSDILSKLEDDEIALRFQSNNVAAVIEPVEGDSYYYLIAPVQI